MEVSAKTLREVEFREKMRGYHPEDVDNFLEQVAAGIEVLQDRLRQAAERAQRAEAAATEAGGADDTLRKTLVLAQRTADLAVQEAREQASRILASAEQQAQSIISDAEERGRRAHEDAVNETRAELGRLENLRAQSQQEVDTLQRWVEEHRAHLQASLSDALASVERAGVLWPAPASRPLDPSSVRGEIAGDPEPPGNRAVPAGAPAAAAASMASGEVSAGASALPPAPPAVPGGSAGAAAQAQAAASQQEQFGLRAQAGGADPTIAWDRSLAERDRPHNTAPSAVVSAPSASSVLNPREGLSERDDETAAMDDFFDDNGKYSDDRRFGRRRRR